MRTGPRLALAAAVAVAAASACSGGGDGGPQLTGTVASLVPAFCVQQGGSSTCFVTAHADGVKQSALRVGECVSVAYQAAAGEGASATATKVERSNSC